MKKTKKDLKKLTNTIYEVDQSGRIEQTNKITIIAFSNSRKGTIKVSSQDKRKLQNIFRKAGKSRVFVLQVFAATLYLLLEKFKIEKKLILIDQEYQGYDNLIRSYLIQLSQKRGKIILDPDNIRFGLVGKTSNVHSLGYQAFKKNKADLNINSEDILALVLMYEK